MYIYNYDETNFERNGLGYLTDSISAEISESLNGDYVLNVEYPLNGKLSEYLIEENIIKSKVSNGSYQLFRIKRITKNYSTINIYAQHISYDLLNNFLLDVYPMNLNCQLYGQWLLDHCNFESGFTFYSDIVTTKTGRYVRKNPIEAIMGDTDNSMVNLFGGEVERDNFTFKMLSRKGQNNHVKLQFGKNIKDITITMDITEMYTRVIPQGFDGLLLPEKYVDSPIINNYLTPKCVKVEFSNVRYDPESTEEGVYTNINDAYQELRRLVNELYNNGLDKPSINIKIDWLELSKTTQYYNQYKNLESVQLGDTITSEILGLDYTTRVTKTTYNVLTDTIDKFEIGTITKSIANTLNEQNRAINSINPTSILESAKNTATGLITSAMGGYVYKTQNELYIMDTDNPNTAQKVWRWNINGLGYSSTGINGTYGLAMTMDGQIVADMITTGKLNTNVIEGYDNLSLQVKKNKDNIGDRSLKSTTIAQDISSIQAQISDIADITISSESTEAYIQLDNINASEPIHIEIHPINNSISYIYPSNNTIVGNKVLKTRNIEFKNINTNEIVKYTLPDNLYYYDENNYDTFYLDYDSNQCYIIKKCLYNNGIVETLENPTRVDYEYPTINLTEGNYQIRIEGCELGYIFARLMVINAYTAQYATKVELNSAITMASSSINQRVNQEIQRVDGEIESATAELELKIDKDDNDQVVSMINASADEINIQGNRFVLNSSNFKVSKDGTIEATNGKFNGQVNSTSGNIGGWTIQNGQLTNGYVSINSNGYSTVYTPADILMVQAIINGTVSTTQSMIRHYDFNGDGQVTSVDLLRLIKMIGLD